jgi:hypothetical protein
MIGVLNGLANINDCMAKSGKGGSVAKSGKIGLPKA